MDSSLYAASITYPDFESHLNSYPDYVPSQIQRLEELRLQEIPETLGKRRKDGDAFIEKAEARSLMEWKLYVSKPKDIPLQRSRRRDISWKIAINNANLRNRKRGRYRPNLMSTLNLNTADIIRATTRDAFAAYESDKDNLFEAITLISTVKGVDLATASLLLSCLDPANVPFFSDHLYRYLHWDSAKFRGWDRNICHTMKEYKELYRRCQSMRQRLEKVRGESVSVIDIEMMAYALTKRAHQTTRKWKRKQDGYVEPKKRKREATSSPG